MAAVDRENDRAVVISNGEARMHGFKSEPAMMVNRCPLLFIHHPSPSVGSLGGAAYQSIHFACLPVIINP